MIGRAVEYLEDEVGWGVLSNVHEERWREEILDERLWFEGWAGVPVEQFLEFACHVKGSVFFFSRSLHPRDLDQRGPGLDGNLFARKIK